MSDPIGNYHTIEDGPWPYGTTVAVWSVDDVSGGVPVGAEIDTGVAGPDGTVTFGGLTEGDEYTAFGHGGTMTFVCRNDEAMWESIAEIEDAEINEEFVQDQVQPTPRWRPSREIDARNYAADGATISITALQAAYNAAGGTKYVRLPNGTHDLGTGRLTGQNRLLLKGEHPGACRVTYTPQANPASPAFLNGSTGTPSNLTANAAMGDGTLTVASTSGWAAGDILLLKSTALFSSEASAPQGEFVKVKTVDSGTQVTLRGHVRDQNGYTTANAASAAKVTFLDGVHIEGIGFQPSSAAAGPASLMWLRYCRNVVINDCEVAGQHGAGLRLEGVHTFDVESVFARDGADDTGYGYVIVAAGASVNGSVRGCHIETGHGLVTTNGVSLGGVPRNIVVSACTAIYGGDIPFHTHPACEDITFNACSVTGARRVDELVNYGPAFHVAGRNCKLIAPVVNGVYGNGIFIDASASGTVIKSPVVKNCLQGSGGGNANGTGIRITGANTRLEDFLVEDCDQIGVEINGPGARLSRGHIFQTNGGATGLFVVDSSDTYRVEDLLVEDTATAVNINTPSSPTPKIRGLRTINCPIVINKPEALVEFGFVWTTDPRQPSVQTANSLAKRVCYQRVTECPESGMLISKIGLWLGTVDATTPGTTDQLAVAVYSSGGYGRTATIGARKAASASVTGVANLNQVPLSASVIVYKGDWFAVALNSATTTIQKANPTNNPLLLGLGFFSDEAALIPPTTPTAPSATTLSPMMIGIV